MAILPPVSITRAGVTISGAAASGGGDKFASSGKEVLYVKNGDSASHNVIIAVQATVDGQAAAARTIAVPAGAEVLIGPFQPSVYNDANGQVNVTYSAVTSVSVEVLSVSAFPPTA